MALSPSLFVEVFPRLGCGNAVITGPDVELEEVKVRDNTVMVGGSRVLVVHYEDFLQDKMGQLRTVLGHLNIAPDSRRFQCVEFADLEFYKRRSSQSTKHIFTKKWVAPLICSS